MFTVSHKHFVAIEVVLYIALESGDKAVSSKEICTHLGVSQRYLEQMLQQLVKHKVLKGSRGPKGGYTIFREKRKIMLSDIVQAVMEDGKDVRITPLFKRCVMPVMGEVQHSVMDTLDSYSLWDMCEAARQSHSAGESRTTHEFMI